MLFLFIRLMKQHLRGFSKVNKYYFFTTLEVRLKAGSFLYLFQMVRTASDDKCFFSPTISYASVKV